MKVIQYQESFGPIKWQDGFENELASRSIEEQMRCYALTDYRPLCDVPYRELENEIRKSKYTLSGVHAVYDNWSAIVNNGVVVGVAYDNYDIYGTLKGQVPLMPYQGFVYDTTSDNNGSGYKERKWYKYLICLPCSHTLW